MAPPPMTAMAWMTALAAMNLLSFALMGLDKRRARRKAWRISERALLLACIPFGALGGMAGMLLFRHKTQHAKFALSLPLLLSAQVAAVALLVGRGFLLLP